MMDLLDMIQRTVPPAPWAEGQNIPWSDPAFSERMLREHLSQAHHHASRRFAKIDEQVRWIHGELLSERPTRIVELTCGPGLYTSRLARLGHECVGIDYAPAAIAYARDCARKEGLACTYLLEDVRQAAYGEGFGLVMVISGQFNVFRRGEAQDILHKARAALADDGLLLLEPQRFATVERTGKAAARWHSRTAGLFSDEPHLCLQENFWEPKTQTATERFFIIDAATGRVARHALSTEAYTDEQFRSALIDGGFADIELLPSLIGVEDESQSVNLVLVARRPKR